MERESATMICILAETQRQAAESEGFRVEKREMASGTPCLQVVGERKLEGADYKRASYVIG